jgi:hypothetical protein
MVRVRVARWAVFGAVAVSVFVLAACGSRSALLDVEADPSGGAAGSMAAGRGGSGAGQTGGVAGSGGTGMAGVGGVGAPIGCPPDAGEPGPRRALTRVTTDAPWDGGQFTLGMAVDTQGRLFIAGYEAVHVLAGSRFDVYLTSEDVAFSLGKPVVTGFGDLDLATDDSMYVATSMGILHSRAPHQVRLWRASSPGPEVDKLGVPAAEEVAFMDREGLWFLSNSVERRLFEKDRIQGATDCATEDLAVARTGVFLYQPGCQGSPLLRGDLRVESLSVLFPTTWQGQSPIQAEGFRCVTRDPAGGFYLVVEHANDDLRLYHVAEYASDAADLTLVNVVPSLSEAGGMQNHPRAFYYCSMAAGRDGTIFLQTFNQLWMVMP